MKRYFQSGNKGLLLIEQGLNSSLSFAAVALIYSKGSDKIVTQIALSTTFGYGVSAVLKSKLITNLYLRNGIANTQNQNFVITQVRLRMINFFFLCPVVPLLSLLSGRISFIFALQLSFLIYFITCLDLIRNLLIYCEKLKSTIISASFGLITFIFLNLIFISPESNMQITFWIISLFLSFFSICILEKTFIFQEIADKTKVPDTLIRDSKNSTIESLLTTTTNFISYFLISHYFVSFGAHIQRTYIIFCALPMMVSLAITPYINLLFRRKRVAASERLLHLLSLESMFLFFPLLVIHTPIVDFFDLSASRPDNYFLFAVLVYSALNVFFFVYGVWIRTFWGFRKFFLIRACYLFVQNFLVLFCVHFLGIGSFFYVELATLVLMIILWVLIEISIRRSET